MNQPRFENRSRRDYSHAEWEQQQLLKPHSSTLTVSQKFVWTAFGLAWVGGFLVGFSIGGFF